MKLMMFYRDRQEIMSIKTKSSSRILLYFPLIRKYSLVMLRHIIKPKVSERAVINIERRKLCKPLLQYLAL